MFRKFRFMLILCIVSVLFAAMPVIAEVSPDINNSLGLNEKVIRTSWKIVNYYWNILEMRYTFNEIADKNGIAGNELVEKYKKEMKKFQLASASISARIIKALTRNDNSELKRFSKFYKDRTNFEKPAFELAVREVIEFIKFHKLNSVPDDFETRTYFPGYGYSDPDYIYRKGLELENNMISIYWQDEERVLETSKHFEGSLEIGVAAGLRDKVANYREIGEPFRINIGGSIKVCIKVVFDVKETITTKSKKQYAVSKIWFELFKARRDFWSSPKWEICGKTYELRDEPTGIAATVSAEIKK